MRRSRKKLTLRTCATIALCLAGSRSVESAKSPYLAGLEDFLGIKTGNVYVGLSYGPSWSSITGFKIGALDGSTHSVHPLLRGATNRLSTSFNWHIMDPRIRFGHSMLFAFEGSLGYKEGNARVEIEIGHRKFEIQKHQPSSRTSKADTVYLLAKALPHDVVSGNTTRLSRSLSKVKANEIVVFAQSVGRQAKNIDNKICNRRGGAWNNRGTEAYAAWSCDELSYSDNPGRMSEGYGLSHRFGNLHGHNLHYPGMRGYYEGRGWPGTSKENIRTATGMAEDLTINLSADERSTIAGILSKTISGAEVVEIRAITATSIMVNACYDLQFNRSFIIPFFCAGVGTNFVGIVEGHTTSRVAYKIEAGLSYSVTSRITAFFGGFYSRILGGNGYYDLPTQRMQDDISPDGRSNSYAKASFKMAYMGAEAGIRLVF